MMTYESVGWMLIGADVLMSVALVVMAVLFLGWNVSLGPTPDGQPLPPIDRWLDKRAARKCEKR